MNSDNISRAVHDAATALITRIKERLGDDQPVAAVTMGSGLEALADVISDPLEVPYSELPGWPNPTVPGHAGRVIIGTLSGVPVIGLSGRVHLYEGGSASRTAFYVRVVGELGIRILFLSNASGAIRQDWRPGELMLLTDHINLTGDSPLIGPVVGTETRFPDMTVAYDADLRDIVRTAANEQGLTLHEGIYAAVHGPAFETPAEIRMLRSMGADAVGMSTVPEVITARALGIRCVAVSCLTNLAAGLVEQPLDHLELLETTRLVEKGFQRLVELSITRFTETRTFS